MDFSKLNQNEKLAVYGAAASVIGPILASVGFGFGAGILTLLLAIAMLAIVFLPQLSPGTALPGSKGSLMVIVGGIAAGSAALALLGSIGWLGLFGSNIVFVLGWLIGIAGGLLMGWAGWKEFQAEGGQLKLGTPAPAASSDAGASAAPAEPPTPTGSAASNSAPPPAESAPPPAESAPDATAGDPYQRDDEDRPTP